MIRASFLAIATSLLLAGTACATPVLKSDITVIGSVVTAGDLFDDAGVVAETALFRSPQPGTTGTVPLAAISQAAQRAGFDFLPNGLGSVRVTRAATIVDETTLQGLIAADLTRRGIITAGMSALTLFTTPIAPISAESVAEPARLLSLRYLPGSASFTAQFQISGTERPLTTQGTIDLMVQAPHLVGNLAAGTVLTAADVVMQPVPLRYAESTGVASLDQLVGMALNRQSRQGMMLKPADVSTPLLIGKNDPVTIYFRKGPMTLTVKGQAITGAASGAPLQVLNLMSKRVISATALAAGAVEVVPDAMTLAGL